MKESFIKAVGKGLYIPLNSFAFSISEDKEFILKVNPYPENFFFKQYEINPQYKLSVCSKTFCFPQKVNEINYTNLIPNSIYGNIKS
ncbi:4'-phosphopantetheinyl transferase [Bacillus thuringiensis serovar pondicheriensis BGSC 4BA1]|nr:4'-phosphopantetheinyl transferase [Bacillus cereus BGSC 6E1]EEM74005.1 4'-phosphopantetheinyl transferase [Bacillus thuringiensis serovar pondicheriensis BGSC 4BA1]